MGSAVVHFEVMGTEAEQLNTFYAGLFGWKIDPMPGANYAGVDTQAGTGMGGGLGLSQDGSQYVTFYITVDDTEAALAEISKAGGAHDAIVHELDEGVPRSAIPRRSGVSSVPGDARRS